MSTYSAPLEMLADAAGSVTFGWADEGVFYARFTRCLTARLGEAFAGRLRAAVQASSSIKYFADGRSLESYDLLARSAFVRVVTEHRKRFGELTLLSWSGSEISPGFVSALGGSVVVTRDAEEFEAQLSRVAPRARLKLNAKPDSPQRSRWSMRR